MYWYFYFDPNTFGECINTIITVFFFDMLRDYYPRSMYRPSWHDLHDNRGQYMLPYNTMTEKAVIVSISGYVRN